jgi:hypothetical protein
MTATTTILKKLMSYIADAGDKKVKALCLLVEDDMADAEKFKLSADYIKILEEERYRHLKGKSKSSGWTEIKDIIRNKKKL